MTLGIAPKHLGTFANGGMFLIEKRVLSAASNTVTFSNIPQNFNHLKLVVTGRSSIAGLNASMALRFNNDSSGNYDTQQISGVAAGTASCGDNVGATSLFCGYFQGATATANTPGAFETSLMFYTNTTFYKALFSIYGMHSASTASLQVGLIYGQYRSTSSINSITIIDGSGNNIIAGSLFCLYGIY